MPSIDDSPKLRIPFEHGWRRELVQRAPAAPAPAEGGRSGGWVRADAYYFSPQGKKLRSIKETEAYLKETNSPVEVSCFSFSRHLLGAGPPLERLRNARPVGAAAPARKTAAAATAGKKTAAAKMIQRKKHSITLGDASSVIKLGVPASVNPQKMHRKHSLMEKSRKAFAFKAMELKKKMPAFSEATKLKPAAGPLKQRGRPVGSGGRGRVLLHRPWLLAEVDDRGDVQWRRPPDAATTGEYFRLVRASGAAHTAEHVLIGRRRLAAPCSLFCFVESQLSPLALPSAQCLVCRCLSHPACVGLEDANLTSFVCVDCHAGVSRGRGFDGLGDSDETDSESASESESDSDSVEELLAVPPPPPPPPLMVAGPRFAAPSPLPPGVKRPRGRPRLPMPRLPRPGAVRGAYARRRMIGGGRGARFVSSTPRLAGPGPAAAAPAADTPGSQLPVAAAAATADAPAKKRSWKDP